MKTGNNIISLVTMGVLTEDFITETTSSVPAVAAKNSLREMLARSGTFQTAIDATGTSSQKIEAAKNKIYLTAYISEEMGKPFAAIFKDETDNINAISGGESQEFVGNGSLEVRFEKEVPAALIDSDTNEIIAGQEGSAEQDFEEFYGGCVADINSQAGTEGYLFIRRWKLVEGPSLYESSETQKNIYAVRLVCEWGLE